MGKKQYGKSGPDYKAEALASLLAKGFQQVRAEVGPNGRTQYAVVEPEERPKVDPVEAEKITTDPSMTPEQVKAWFNEPDRHTVFGKQEIPDEAVGLLTSVEQLQKLLGDGFNVTHTPIESDPVTKVWMRGEDGTTQPVMLHWSAEFTGKAVRVLSDAGPGADVHQLISNMMFDEKEAPVAVYRDEDEKNEYGRKKLNELQEMQLRWAEEVKRMGLADQPGSLLYDTVNTVIEMNRVISETEAAEAAYGYQDLKCVVMMVGEKPEPGSIGARIGDLKEWWLQKAADDVTMVAEKAVTYGSNSLEQLGRKMAQLNGRRDISAEEAQELGCWVYLEGKAERWTDAVMRGERPKDDTILDIAMYATMAARIRNAGGWPDSQG